MSYEIAEVLDGAADVIERDGWCQNDLTSDDGRHCLMGAIGAHLGTLSESGWWNLLAFDEVESKITAARDAAALAAQIDVGPGMNVANWNDAPERTEQEVLDALRLAAKQERIKADGVSP